MKFSEAWLREWVNPAINTEQLCEQITMLGLEVDNTEKPAGNFSGVVVGEVIECAPHPNADKLKVTKVNIGNDILLNIVCGAANCRKGLKVACAIIGATLPNNLTIKKAKLRDVISEGMLCAYSELGIAIEADGIIELPNDAQIGQLVREYLQLEDNIIDISLTPNRADCLSILGVAREVAVDNQLTLQLPPFTKVKPSIVDKINISISEPEACPRYLLRVIKNVNLKASSPIWLTEKLRRSGIRSIDPVVDVTNFCLMELGQPMHAFDADKIAGSIDVRMAREGETLCLLNDATVKLNKDTLVIADKNGPLAMAGVFGGKLTGVTEQTKNIALEVAFFNPLAIVNKARGYGLHTDSSHRFERGVDFQLQYQAMERATALLLEICGGEAGEICESVSVKHLPNTKQIALRRTKLNSVLGYSIPTETISDILERLGLQPKHKNDIWLTTAPSWRFDIAIEEDLIEEIARIYGYNRIPSRSPIAHLKMRQHRETLVELSRIKTMLVDYGYQEVITYSFVDPKKQKLLYPEQSFLTLPNPISLDMSVMRVSLLTGLLDTVVYNQNRQQNRIRLFESGLCFIPDSTADLGVRQEFSIAAVITGTRNSENWANDTKTADYFDLKGDLENLLSITNAGKSIEFIAKAYPALHPGQSAAIILDGKEIGYIGTIHPNIIQQLGLHSKAIAFEIRWPSLNQRDLVQAKAISRFPANRRDLAIVVENGIAASDIIQTCKAIAGEKVNQIDLFDVYQGSSIAEGYKSLALSFIIQDHEKTLEENDINIIVNNIVLELKQRFNAYLRD